MARQKEQIRLFTEDARELASMAAIEKKSHAEKFEEILRKFKSIDKEDNNGQCSEGSTKKNEKRTVEQTKEDNVK